MSKVATSTAPAPKKSPKALWVIALLVAALVATYVPSGFWGSVENGLVGEAVAAVTAPEPPPVLRAFQMEFNYSRGTVIAEAPLRQLTGILSQREWVEVNYEITESPLAIQDKTITFFVVAPEADQLQIENILFAHCEPPR